MSEPTGTVWVIDDDRSIRWVIERALARVGIGVECFERADGLVERMERAVPDAIISDIRMPGSTGLALLREVGVRWPEVPVIIMTAFSDLESTVSAYRGGAFEYLPKPFDVDEVVAVARRALAFAADRARASPPARASLETDILGSAPAMQDLFRAIGRLSRSHLTVLVTGESGTGKELVARALHEHSPRRGRAFIALNTAAIPRDLLESELFGHERGAFTGAQQQRRGRFEQADGGTLFLDEIGDMPPELQTRLLRVLAAGEFFRVGGYEPVRVDVRIVAATHQDLERGVRAGRFREDLYHRLNVIRVHVPALRERRTDIPLLAEHFLEQVARELDIEPKTLHPLVERRLLELDWPGNVRQLENTCRWLTVMAAGNQVLPEDLPADLRGEAAAGAGAGGWEEALQQWAAARLGSGERRLLDEALPRFERVLIDTALRHTGGRRQEAAALLGWGRNTLTRKINEHAGAQRPGGEER